MLNVLTCVFITSYKEIAVIFTIIHGAIKSSYINGATAAVHFIRGAPLRALTVQIRHILVLLNWYVLPTPHRT